MIIALISVDPGKYVITDEAFNLKDAPFFTQRSIKALIRTFSKEISKVLDTPSYKEHHYEHGGKKYRFCTKVYKSILVSVVAGAMPSYSIMKMMDEASCKNFKTVMKEYENWKDKCSIVEIYKELEEAKAVVTDTLENVLARGEKLDKLVDKSEELSTQSKALFHAAKKQNRCCKIG